LTLLAHRGLSAEFVQRVARLPLEMALAGRQLNLQQPLSWSVEEYPEGELKRLVAAENLQLMLAVPLVARGKLMGGLVLNCRRPGSLSPEESSLLIAAGQQIGLALENARLLELERSGREEANRRREVAEGLRETLQLLVPAGRCGNPGLHHPAGLRLMAATPLPAANAFPGGTVPYPGGLRAGPGLYRGHPLSRARAARAGRWRRAWCFRARGAACGPG
jgi:hypothetical protein